MKRILLSLGAITFVAALAIGASGAFFSDTETSTGNTFTAGAIDLTVDSTQHYNGNTCTLFAADATTSGTGYLWSGPSSYPVPGTPCDGTWLPANLGAQKFFNFPDVKPGDSGEDTISLHVDNNDAYACADVSITSNAENVATQPELNAGDTAANGNFDGELAQNLNFFAWADNGVGPQHTGAGDNIWQVGEPALFSNNVGPASDVLGGKTYTLADSTTGPLPGGATNYIGLAWCAGTMTASNGVITCDGAGMDNKSQTDSMTADVAFRVEQARNNPNFSCATGAPSTIGVGANDLDPGPRANAVTDGSGKWFMYNDTSDTIDNTLGSFVVGPSSPPAGSGSVEFTLGANPLDRKDIATYAYQGTLLSSISTLAFSAYSHNGSGGAGATESPYLVFDVDFATTTTSLYSGRLVYVPSANGGVPQDTWNTYNTTGSGLWTWSGLAKGPDKIASTGDDNTWPDGNTNAYRTWANIVAAFPNAKISSTAGLLGVRVGEPGPTGYIGNVDKFQINIGTGLKTYDFGN